MTTRDETKPVARLGAALIAALQWRVVVLWTIGLLLPTLVVWLPLWRTLGGIFDWSPRAPEASTWSNGLPPIVRTAASSISDLASWLSGTA